MDIGLVMSNHDLTAVVIMHHSPANKGYLDLCLKSLERQYVPMQVIVVNSSERELNYPKWVNVIDVPHTTNSAVAGNLGFKHAHPDAEYFLFLNDDTCLTAGSVQALKEVVVDSNVIVNPFSNCDVDFFYAYADMTLRKEGGQTLKLPRFFDLDYVKGFEEELMQSRKANRVIIPVPFVCFYATMMRAEVWRTLGGLDEQFESGPDDRDFCMRAKQIGVQSVVDLSTTIWHFGGKTIATKDAQAVAKNRIVNAKKFESKWGQPQ